ncbi:MAG: TIGR01440 family protein [Oscillospiraceae bacterium]|jgi:uncharacterized protein (TIGR01440 family)|nr:TIGR01440 family protein [Oscillospiraceae bacterium]
MIEVTMSVLANPSDLSAEFIAVCQQQLSDILKEAAAAVPADCAGDSPRLLVIGCSTSEVGGGLIGTSAYENLGAALARTAIEFCKGFRKEFPKENKLHLAAQCCEHLNRALVVSKETMREFNLTRVIALPTPEAGGSFPSAVYNMLENAVLARDVSADIGLDIGGTLIGMHVRRVAVPVRLSARTIGHAHVTAAYSRPEYTGGARAKYT